MSHLVVAIECYEQIVISLVCISRSLALFPSPTKLLGSESPKSLKDACMVESISSPRGDGKRQRCIGENSNDMSYADAMRQDDIEKDDSHMAWQIY